MTIRVALHHVTRYDFDRAVNLSPHIVRLRPAAHSRTPIHSYSLKIQPETHFINWQQDAFGNYLARLVFPEKTRHFEVKVEVLADMTVINPFDFFLEESAENVPFEYDEQEQKELLPYLEKWAFPKGGLFSKALKEFHTLFHQKDLRTIDFLVAINQSLQEKIDYTIRLEPGVQNPEDTLKKALGSCRDSGWLLVQLLRHLGLAARFVSGYLVQLTPDEKPIEGPAGPNEDFTDLHAWCEVYLPGAGWVGLDPTSGLFAGEGHIPLACTPDPVSAAPIEGFTDKCEVTFSYTNEVSRFHEDPRVTKPYSDAQWADILALGDAVDAGILGEDIRLTMGGEPTFVSVDDMESAQWNTEALGQDKLRLAKSLLLRLRDHFAPRGLLHYGQGKWYPGEEVPRWALGVFWRTDGEALWHNPDLLARVDKDYGAGIDEAESLAQAMGEYLAVESRCWQPTYEDAFHYLRAEQDLPVELELAAARASDEQERRRVAEVLHRGLDKPTGYVLPLQRHWRGDRWETCVWKFRGGRLSLVPGDSPMGLRLPLKSLSLAEEPPPKDPFSQPEKLSKAHHAKPKAEIANTMIGTALGVEPRGGRLYVFFPPLTRLEDYVLLIQAVEAAAEACGTPVVIEGYEPPRDSRLQKLLVTPDPGVIEVNIHPARSWRELVANTTELYDAARESRLGTEKFMLDGRHTGTGGGNHITLGAAHPEDSPFLRRPSLLQSFITYWQHHPSLSYLFSSAFVGPTSQAPRVDEGRDEILYELEIAFSQMPEGDCDQPWLVDRLMRNLLIDITGNTHRAEFCIDKLYSPGGTTGRLGLLEFRGFEMPPHSRMALVQALLLRTLVLRFWREPYRAPLVRWGTLLHDRFMLPHFVWQDIQDVVADLQAHDLPFKSEWLLPFEEFRFPHYGRVNLDGVELELRWAIEPWHVLGEEATSFGNARYVDSSVERLQVRVSGIHDNRYVLSCNGRRVPLHTTGRQGEFVAGVRYRAWSPPSALHPMLGVDTPLHFDLIDTWNGRSIGGCSYHVAHPGGRNYDVFPVNAFEAEARRISRFGNVEHTPGPFTPRPDIDALREFFPEHHPPRPMAPPVEEAPGEFPNTLDLRRQGPRS